MVTIYGMRLTCGIYISNLSSRMAGAWKAPRQLSFRAPKRLFLQLTSSSASCLT